MDLPFITRFKLFHKMTAGVLILFMGIMVFVIFKAYSRQSGNTGLDMAKVLQMRNKTLPNNETSNTADSMPQKEKVRTK